MPVVRRVSESLINCADIVSVSRDDVLLAIGDVRATEKGEIDRVFLSSAVRSPPVFEEECNSSNQGRACCNVN